MKKPEHFEKTLLSRPGWQREAKALMAAKRPFVLTGWDFSFHHADCAALAEDFDYHYRLYVREGRACFWPR